MISARPGGQSTRRIGGSFRDPAGFVFIRDGEIHRQVNQVYAPHLAMLQSSGLYRELTEADLLVRHQEVSVPPLERETAACVIRPEPIPFISYPYEWCFSQLKDAALATLDIQLRALRYGMLLKDASAFNIQFLAGRPILIDSLSFRRYEPGEPWVAYRQFCEHFLAPLLLIRHIDPRLARLSALNVDGVPLELASRLLPVRTCLRPSTLLHIHLHAHSIKRYGRRDLPKRVETRRLSTSDLVNLTESLRRAVDNVCWDPGRSEWSHYEEEHGYSRDAMEEKRRVIARMLGEVSPSIVWDLGANTGEFSDLAREAGSSVVAIDFDPCVVERMYRRVRKTGDEGLHPLWIDLRNPSPSQGWAGRERDSLAARSRADAVLALALVHHLAIGANVPLRRIARWFAKLAPVLILEFVPKGDPRVQRLLVARRDVFKGYHREGFEAAFRRWYDEIEAVEISDSGRTLYRYHVRQQ